MDEPIIKIIKGSEDYPKSLLTLGEYAPDYILAQGNIKVLKERIAAFISTEEINEDNSYKLGVMCGEVINSVYHYMYDIESSIGHDSLLFSTYDCGDRPIVIFDELCEDENYDLSESDFGYLDGILEDGGLLLSFHYIDDSKWQKSGAKYIIMSALADVVAVPYCSKSDTDVIMAMKEAKGMGKKVLINEEDYIKLFKD